MALIPKDDIQTAKEKLGDRNAELIVELLHPAKYNEQRKIGCCVNPAHHDDTPSFSYNPKSYSFYCFGCHQNVDLLDAYMMTGCSFLEACEKLFEEAEMPFKYADRESREREYYYPEPIYAGNKNAVYEYWQRRHISKATIDYLHVEQDPRGNTLFQYYDLNDVLVGVKVRPSRPVKHGEGPKCWWLKDTEGKPYSVPSLLFNANRINTSQPLVVCSGEGDCASCIEAGITNTTSIHGGDGNLKWIEEQWDFLQNFDVIILCADNDESGRKFANEVTRRLGEYRVRLADIPETLTTSDGVAHSIKDVNELLYYGGVEAVRRAINDAKEAEIPNIVDYADVGDFNMGDVDGFKSGFEELDELLDKFYVGTVNIVTGVAGAGKSSFLSTLICQSVEQGFPAFIYSGELSNRMLRSWVDSVHAGQGHLERIERSGYTYYKIDKASVDRLSQFYRGQTFFYKDSASNKVDDILKSMEAAVRRFGVKSIFIDNMTSVDLCCGEDNIWQKQNEFIRSLVEFAQRWQVVLVLVLHPRKMDTVRRMGLFDLSGVTSSVNLSHRVISLYRVQDADRQGEMSRNGKWIKKPLKGNVVLDIQKDRFGSGGGRSMSLWYDKPSKRFYTNPDNLAYRYAWDKGGTSDMLQYFDRSQWDDNDDEVFGA